MHTVDVGQYILMAIFEIVYLWRVFKPAVIDASRPCGVKQVKDEAADAAVQPGAEQLQGGQKPSLSQRPAAMLQPPAYATPGPSRPTSPRTPMRSLFSSPQPTPIPASPLSTGHRQPSISAQDGESADAAARADPDPNRDGAPADAEPMPVRSASDASMPQAPSNAADVLHDRRVSNALASTSTGTSPADSQKLEEQSGTRDRPVGSKADRAVGSRGSGGRSRSAVNYTLLAGKREQAAGGTPKRSPPVKADRPDKPPRPGSDKVQLLTAFGKSPLLEQVLLDPSTAPTTTCPMFGLGKACPDC